MGKNQAIGLLALPPKKNATTHDSQLHLARRCRSRSLRDIGTMAPSKEPATSFPAAGLRCSQVEKYG